jgi:hypothetical protein
MQSNVVAIHATGLERIRMYHGTAIKCLKHQSPVVESVCEDCVAVGKSAGDRLRIRLESPSLLGGLIKRAVENHRSARIEFDEFMRSSGIKAVCVSPPHWVQSLLDPSTPIPAPLRANTRIGESVAWLRLAQQRVEQAIEKLGYAGYPLEQKLERLFDESDQAASVLDAWDGIAFDGSHERQLEVCAQRMLVNDRDARNQYQTLRYRNLTDVRAAAAARDKALADLTGLLRP